MDDPLLPVKLIGVATFVGAALLFVDVWNVGSAAAWSNDVGTVGSAIVVSAFIVVATALSALVFRLAE